MPRPRARRSTTAAGADEVAHHEPAKKRATKKDLDERERHQSSKRKAPGPARQPAKKAAAKRGSDATPTDPS